jgi:hypothetical protein
MLYIVTNSGYIALSDGASMLAVSRGVIHGHLNVPCVSGVAGVGGHCYSIYGLGWSLLALPLYLLGLAAEWAFRLASPYSASTFAASFLNPLLAASTAFVLARFVFALSGSFRKAIAIAAIFGLATPAWPMTKDGFSEPLVMLLLLWAAYLLRHGRTPSQGDFVLAGSLLGFALLTRIDAAPEAAAVVLYGLWPENRRADLGRAAATIAPFVLIAATALAYNQARFGAIWRTGYESYGLSLAFHRSVAGFLTGLVGLLADPTRGLIWFVPAFVISVLMFLRFARFARAEASLCLGLFAIAWIEHANLFDSWQAGWSWGPRFLMAVLPFLLLPLTSLPIKSGLTCVAACLSGIGILINLGPVLVDYSRYFYAQSSGVNPGPWPQIYLWKSAMAVVGNATSGDIPSGRITELAPAGGAAILHGSTWLNSPDFWWFYLMHAHVHGRFVLLVLTLMLATLALLIWMMRRALGTPRDGSPTTARLLPAAT